MLKVTCTYILHVLKLINQWFFVDYFSEIDVKSFKCVSWLKTFFYKDVLQANDLWKWNHFLAKLWNLTLELCHFDM